MANTKGTRASNGDGNIRQRSDGRWEGRYTAPSGKQKSVYASSKSACKAALKRVQAEIEFGAYIENTDMTLAQWLNEWLKNYTGNIKPTTHANYQRYADYYFIPYLGSMRLSKIKPIHIQRMFNMIDLKESSKKTVKIALSSALGTAVRFDLIQSNPCRKVTFKRSEPAEMHIIDRTDIPRFIEAAQQTKYGDALVLLLQTGIRSGELRGLRWSDIDFENKVMTVSQQIVYLGKNAITQSTKSGKTRRIVLIDDTIDLLKRHRQHQAEDRLKYGGWEDNDMNRDLVFRKSNGEPYGVHLLMRPTKEVGKALGMDLHPHDLRHSYAVAALRSGIEVKTVQNNLGHTTAAMTLDTYAKYTDDMGKIAADKFAKYWHDSQKLGSN